jgi:hypothetical protein
MLLRIYLFTLPMMVFFAAALLYTAVAQIPSWRVTLAVTGISIVLLGGFLFTRYGNERMDYMTPAEVDGMYQLYTIAPAHSLLIAGWNNTPWQFQSYEQYTYFSMTDILAEAVKTKDVDSVVRFVEKQKYPHTYLVFTRSQKANADLFSGLPSGTLDQLEHALLMSGKFKVVYENADVQILVFTGAAKGGT